VARRPRFRIFVILVGLFLRFARRLAGCVNGSDVQVKFAL
jgi:hypothetical protein